MFDRNEYDTKTLEALPRISEGHSEDLKVETTLDDGTPARVWLSRCGLDDGELWENTVTLETCPDGRWVTVQRWNGDDPDECQTPGGGDCRY